MSDIEEKAIAVAEAALLERERRQESKKGKLVEGTYNAAAADLEAALNDYEKARDAVPD